MDLDTLIAYLQAAPERVFGMFAELGHFLGPLALLTFSVIAIAYVVLRVRRRHLARRLSWRLLRRLIFPRRVFLHRSAINDYAIAAINHSVLAFALGTAIVAPDLLAEAVVATGWSLGLEIPEGQSGLPERIGLSLYLLLVWDFAATFAHYLKHRVPVLWEFHKVHHSAEVLNPITALRRHPVENLFGGAVVGLCIGVAMGTWILAFGSLDPVIVFGAWIGILVWRVLVYNLRHSQIPLSFGPFWSHIFFSPLQHQIHHGSEPRHYNVNYGHIFSLWDRMLGTLYVPAADERVRFGLGGAEAHDYRSVAAIYLLPFRKAFMLVWRRLTPRQEEQQLSRRLGESRLS